MRSFMLALLVLLPAYTVAAQEQPTARFSQFYAAAEKFDSGRMAYCNKLDAEYYPVDWKVERVTKLALNAMYVQEHDPSSAGLTPEELLEQLDKLADSTAAERQRSDYAWLRPGDVTDQIRRMQEAVRCAIRQSVLLQEHHPDAPLIDKRDSIPGGDFLERRKITLEQILAMGPFVPLTPTVRVQDTVDYSAPASIDHSRLFAPYSLPRPFTYHTPPDFTNSGFAIDSFFESERVRAIDQRLSDLETQQKRERFEGNMGWTDQDAVTRQSPRLSDQTGLPVRPYRSNPDGVGREVLRLGSPEPRLGR